MGKRTLCVGVTGSAGAGKSTLCAFWTARGAERVDADAVGRELLLSTSPVFPELVITFGGGILDAGGEIDRRALGALVFADRAQLERLNRIVHPPLLAELHRRLAAFRQAPGPARILLMDAALLAEWGDRTLWDCLVLVTAPRAAQVARLGRTRGLTPDEAAARIGAQLPDAERRKWADEVVENAGDLARLESEADRLWSNWRGLVA